MLATKYMSTIKNIPKIFDKIKQGTAPAKFTVAHLTGLGFSSSNDRSILGVLKELGFLSADGAPTDRYHAYRDSSKSEFVMAEALRDAYQDLFHINENITETDRDAVVGKFKSAHNATDLVAERQARTFFALLKLADIKKKAPTKKAPLQTDTQASTEKVIPDNENVDRSRENGVNLPEFSGLRYNIEIHLPPTKDPEVYNAIFKALKEHLLDS